jgi:hypothetical protein
LANDSYQNVICTLCYKQIILICDYQVDEAMWVTEKAVQKAKSEWKEAHALMEELMFKPQFLTFKAWVWAAATVSNLSALLFLFWLMTVLSNSCYSIAVWLNGGHGAAMEEWRGKFSYNCHRKFVKDCLPWRLHGPQWRVYMANFCSSPIRRRQHCSVAKFEQFAIVPLYAA